MSEYKVVYPEYKEISATPFDQVRNLTGAMPPDNNTGVVRRWDDQRPVDEVQFAKNQTAQQLSQ